MDNLFRVRNNGKHEKSKILQAKDNILVSIQEVECFLGQGKKVLNGAKLYKILKNSKKKDLS